MINIDSTSKVVSNNIVLGWRLSSVSGWGIYGQNLTYQLKKKGRNPTVFLKPHLLDPSEHQLKLIQPIIKKQTHLEPLHKKIGVLNFECPVLHALRNDFQPSLAEQPSIGKLNIAVIFFETSKISSQGLKRAREYDLVVTGSKWNEKILKKSGINNVINIQQGVDTKIFYKKPKKNIFGDRFVIFSGGKLEYRKGQDIVVSAFKLFNQKYPNSLLIFSWENQWNKIVQTLKHSQYTNGYPKLNDDGDLLIDTWLLKNGLPNGSFINLGQLANKKFPDLLSSVDMALFPNRCEPGTNLVAMESMSMGIPCIISANTGHLDIMSNETCYSLLNQRDVDPYQPYDHVDGWGESSMEEILDQMEKLYLDYNAAQKIGENASIYMKKYSWDNQVDKLLGAIDDLGGKN